MIVINHKNNTNGFLFLDDFNDEKLLVKIINTTMKESVKIISSNNEPIILKKSNIDFVYNFPGDYDSTKFSNLQN